MEGVALLGIFIVITMLLRWFVVHDKAPDGKTHGLFAMREPEDAQANQIMLAGRGDPRAAPAPVTSGAPSKKQS
jgi:hypothetical protein